MQDYTDEQLAEMMQASDEMMRHKPLKDLAIGDTFRTADGNMSLICEVVETVGDDGRVAVRTNLGDVRKITGRKLVTQMANANLTVI